MTIHHPATGFAIGDPDVVPLATKPSPAEARFFFDTLILSASGWRGVFGESDDDMAEGISPAKAYAAARMAAVFADFLLERQTGSGGNAKAPAPVVALGIDTRPTGPAIADVMARVFLARGLTVRYAFICAAPEIMAWTRRSGALPADHAERLDAFCYISASHNPPGHNGVKFGLTDGGVLPGSDTKLLIAALKDGACEARDIEATASLVASAAAKTVAALYSGCGAAKRRAISDYMLFAREVAGASSDLDAQERELDALADAIKARGAGVVAEMNGSARSLSIDEDFLSGLGVSVLRLNAEPRRFAHRIVPEGESLEPCRLALAKARITNPSFALGYVPDCDGDRGNIVYWDGNSGEAKAIEAQDTFALAVLAELSTMAMAVTRHGGARAKTAVACNDATSLRIEAIAKALGAEVFRAETGEANVVGLARSLREQGYEVRVLGEGSNGGVITHPAGVRDPLNTVTAILKLLYLRDDGAIPGPFRLWLERSGQGSAYRDDFGLADVLASLPGFATTSVFEERAALRVCSPDHVALKNAYESIFKKAWPDLARSLERYCGRLTWKALSSSGTAERELTGQFGDSGSGGLKILFSDEAEAPAGFLWMRGSGTEPVFRVMADMRGNDPAVESLLLDRHAAMVREADSLA
jgi:phosphoglucomutase